MMYEIWLHVIGLGFLFAYLFAFEPYTDVVDRYFNFKPFNCVLCMSFWSSVLIYWIAGINIFYAIFTAIIAEFTYRKLAGGGE